MIYKFLSAKEKKVANDVSSRSGLLKFKAEFLERKEEENTLNNVEMVSRPW